MSTIEEIKRAVAELPPVDRARHDELEERAFEKRIESDARAGKLDLLLATVQDNHKAGRREEF